MQQTVRTRVVQLHAGTNLNACPVEGHVSTTIRVGRAFPGNFTPPLSLPLSLLCLLPFFGRSVLDSALTGHVEQALEHARKTFADTPPWPESSCGAERNIMMERLEEVMGLLAFADPKASPAAHLLDAGSQFFFRGSCR